MTVRRQEKTGWIGGWLGGFIWVLILSGVFIVQDKVVQASIGLLIACAAVTVILFFSPWRHPRVQYRLLMTPVYLMFFIAVAWGVWAWGDLQQTGFSSWWSSLILLPIFIPYWTVGHRRWDDHDAG